MEINVYLTNLAKYNVGCLFGKWIELPLSEEKLQKAFDEVLGNDEEYFITDYEAPFSIGEYDNLTELNEFAEQLTELSDWDQEKVIFLIEEIGFDRKEAIDHYEDVAFYQNMTMEDVAYELVEEGIFGDISDSIKSYIDYERLARGLTMDGYNETDKGVFFYS